MSQSGTDDQEVESFILDENQLDSMSQSVLASELAFVASSRKAENIELLDGEDSIDEECISVDPETQSRLEALLEAAGIGKLSTSDGKAFADPEVLRRLTSSVSCALDEAAAALSRMRAETDAQNTQRTLAEACSDGDIIAVRRLLDEGKSIHETTEDGESLLSLACSAGYYELVEVLLSMQANIEDRGPKGECTPLMEAASGGFQSIVELLVSHGADVNATSNTGNTALTFACCGGYTEVVKILLATGADLEVHNENGHTPLMEAASSGHTDVAAILLQHGAGINTHSNEFKESALTLACYKGHLEMVRFLLNAGADQEHKTDEMHTALMEASMDGHVDVARLLLDSGAQVNMPADSFESPLTLAACGGHVELASLLLERGAKIEEVNDEGYTPLMEASREGHEEMVAILIAHGAKINVETEETQETALTLACCGGFLECCELLIQAGADLELGCSTPLMEAAQEGQVEVVKFLLQRGAKVNAQTSSGDTALSYACDHGHTDVADLLLAAGAELDHESEGGRTPLMKAARAGHLCTVQFLISRGADVNKRTKNNDHTVLSLACVYGHLSVVELLLCQGADPTHKLKDGSTMLLEAAKGGHTAVVQMLLDFPYNFLATSMSPSNMQVTPPISEQCTPRVPTHALPMIVPPQEPDKTPSSLYNFSDIMTDSITPNMESEASDNVSECHMESNHCDHKLCPRKPAKFMHQITEDNANEGLIHHPSPYKPCTLSPLHLNASLNGSNDSLSQLSLQELNCLSELEQRIKKAIEKNAHLKSLEVVQTEKVEDMYKNQEEQIVKKQKILEELQKVERELQLKTHQQLRNNYFPNSSKLSDDEVYDVGSSRGKADGQDSGPEEVSPATLEISVATRQGENDIENSKTEEFHYLPFPAPIPPEAFPCDQSCNNPYVMCPSTPIQLVDTTKLKVTATHSPVGEKFPATALATDEIPQIPASPYQSTVIDCCTESNHDTPLTLACAGGHEELVDLLISRGANIEHRDKKGFTPLILAATAGHADVVSILLDANADIESQSERTKDTPLSLACSGGRLEVVEVLLSRGAAKEHRNVSDYTPLSLAASGGYVNIIRVLLRAGAEINSRTGSKLGISPLMLAAMNGHTQAVQLLLDQGADINAQIETNQNTALTLACFQGRHEVVSLLVDRRANIEHRAKTGLTPLMEAASGGYAEVGRVLLQKGADVNAAPVPSSRDTALTIAADKGHYRFCDLLLKHWAIVDVRNKKGNTPFWLACNGGHLDVAQLLLSKDANPSAADNRGIMPLMAAFRKGHLKVTRWLVREVSQFPSDSECMRYIATISDRDLLKRCRMCMECIATAKDKQAQEANKYASELLEELDMEKSREENRKERAARKREKRRLKRKQKQQIINKDEELSMNEMKEALPEIEENQYLELYSYKEEKTADDVPENQEDKISELNPAPSSSTLTSMEDAKSAAKEIRENVKQGKENAGIEKIVENTQNVGNSPTPKIYQKKKTKTELSCPDATQATSRVPVLPSENINTSPVSSAEVSAPHHQTTPAYKRTFRHKVVSKTTRESDIPKPKSYSVTQPLSNYNSSKKVQQKEEGWKEVVRKSKRVIVASNLISRVIGRGGCNINAIRQVTGAHIDIDKQRKGGHERTITIRGATEPIRHAHLLICELIKDDNSDQNINTIIKKVESETLATCKAPSAKSSSAVVEAPLPTRPAWKVPLSDISNPIRSNVKTVVTQAQRIAISASTSFTATTSAKDFSAIQANEAVTNTSTNVASHTSVSTVTFTSKTSDRYSNRPVQPVAPMISLKSTPVKYPADIPTQLITGSMGDSTDLLQTMQNGNNVSSASRGSDISNLAVGHPIISSGSNMIHSNPAAFQSDVRAINLMSNFQQSSDNSKMFITDSVPSPIASTVVGRNLASDMSLYNPNVQYNQADTIGSDRKIWPIGTERARSHRRSAFVQPSNQVESPGMWTFIESSSSAIGDGNYRSFGSNIKNQNTQTVSNVMMSSAPIGPPSIEKYNVPKSDDTDKLSNTGKGAYVRSPDVDGKVLFYPQQMIHHASMPSVQPPIGGHRSGPGIHEQSYNSSGHLVQQHSTINQANMNDHLKPYLQHSSIHDFGGNGKWHQRFMSMPTQHSVMQKNHLLPKNTFEQHRFTQPLNNEEMYYNMQQHQSYHQMPYDMRQGTNNHARNAMSEFFLERGPFIAQQEAIYPGNDKFSRSIGDEFAHMRDREKSIGNVGGFIVDQTNLTPENIWKTQGRPPVHQNVMPVPYDVYRHKVSTMNGEEADTPIMSGTGGMVGYPLPDEMHRGHM